MTAIPPGSLWPRQIAQGYIEDKRTEGWVMDECKKHPNPEVIFQWVRIYIERWLKQKRAKEA